MLEYHTSKPVVTVQSAFRAKDARTRLKTRPFVRGINSSIKLCKQKSNGRPLTAEDAVERVRASFLHSPKKSTGTAAMELSMSKITLEGSA
jgi:hypothetical protein